MESGIIFCFFLGCNSLFFVFFLLVWVSNIFVNKGVAVWESKEEREKSTRIYNNLS